MAGTRYKAAATTAERIDPALRPVRRASECEKSGAPSVEPCESYARSGGEVDVIHVRYRLSMAVYHEPRLVLFKPSVAHQMARVSISQSLPMPMGTIRCDATSSLLTDESSAREASRMFSVIRCSATLGCRLNGSQDHCPTVDIWTPEEAPDAGEFRAYSIRGPFSHLSTLHTSNVATLPNGACFADHSLSRQVNVSVTLS